MSKRATYLLIVIGGIIAYVISLFSPLLSISEFYVFNDTLSFYTIMHTLFYNGEWLLFLAIFIFALILPSLKYTLLLIYGLFLKSKVPTSRTLKMLEAISKWAMLDVFIIAILIASIELKSMASAQTHFGLYLFVAAVLIAMWATYFYKRNLCES